MPDPDAAPPMPDPDAAPPPPPEPRLQTRLEGFSIAGGADEGRATAGGEVPMRLRFSTLIENCPGCAVQVAVGAGPESTCAYDAVPGPAVQTADFSLRAPADPGAFPVRWAAVLDGDCDAARAALAAGENIGRLVVEAAPPPLDPTLDLLFESLVIAGGDDLATVRPGADVPMALRFRAVVEDCPGCAVQVAVGLGAESVCAYDAAPGAGVLNADFRLPAPAAPGAYPVRWAAVLNGDCAAALAELAAGEAIGRVIVEAEPPPPAPSLVKRLEALSIAGGADEARAQVGTNVPISMDFRLTVENCPGCAAQVAVGVGGNSVCAYEGVPGAGVLNARFALPVPAAPGAYPVRWAAVLDGDCAAAQAALANGDDIGRIIAEAGPPPPMNQIPVIDDIALTRPTFATRCRSVVEAFARDPDGDPLTYTWSGDAMGQGARLELPGGPARTVRVSLVVEDGRGGLARRGADLALPACELPAGAVSNAAGDPPTCTSPTPTPDAHRYAAADRFGYLVTITSQAELDLVMGLWGRRESVDRPVVAQPRRGVRAHHGRGDGLHGLLPDEPNNLGGEEYAAELYADACFNDAALATRRAAVIEFELPGSANDVSAGGSFDRPGFAQRGTRTFLRITEPDQRPHPRDGPRRWLRPGPRIHAAHPARGRRDLRERRRQRRPVLDAALALEPGLYDLNVRGYNGGALRDYRLEVDLDAPVSQPPSSTTCSSSPATTAPPASAGASCGSWPTIPRVPASAPPSGATRTTSSSPPARLATSPPSGRRQHWRRRRAGRHVHPARLRADPGGGPQRGGRPRLPDVADLGTYDTQRVEAARRGGHTATLDAAERAFIVPPIDGMLAPWVGVWSPRRDHEFETITGEPLGENPFCPGEPNNAGATSTRPSCGTSRASTTMASTTGSPC
ncbi:MAG: hypothetical protein R3F43_09475 [bacterium]